DRKPRPASCTPADTAARPRCGSEPAGSRRWAPFGATGDRRTTDNHGLPRSIFLPYALSRAASPHVRGTPNSLSHSRGHPIPVLEQGLVAQACIDAPYLLCGVVCYRVLVFFFFFFFVVSFSRV